MTQVTTARRRRARPAEEAPRPTREQQVSRGKAARSEVPRASHAEFAAGPGRPDPVSQLESQAAVAGAGAAADPLRADGGLRLHLLPRCRPPHGPRPRRHPQDRPAHADLRGRPPVQLRAVRLPGAEPGLRHQRLRRDPARAVGVGREAAGGQPGDRRARQRLPDEGAPGDRAERRGPLPHRHARVRAPALARGLVHPRHRGHVDGQVRIGAGQGPPQEAVEDSGQGADEGQPRSPRSLHRHRRRPADDHRSPTADRAAARARRGRGRPGRGGAGAARHARHLPHQPGAGAAGHCWTSTVWWTSPARSSASAASAPART